MNKPINETKMQSVKDALNAVLAIELQKILSF